MSDHSNIEWTDATWNPIVGCSVISPGCTNCYAMKMAARLQGASVNHYHGLTHKVNGNHVWTGKVAVAPDNIFLAPLSWKKPKRIFVNSMGDLFHEAITDNQIDCVFAVMGLCPQHTFQVLTKRARRMREYITARYDKRTHLPIIGAMNMMGAGATQSIGCRIWPLPNVWLGVSVERQQEADERIPLLLQTPTAIRFVSCEPLLGPIDFSRFSPVDADWNPRANAAGAFIGLHWVIIGGESGSDARPMHPQWTRDIRDQCVVAHVPFFFKQWGRFAPADWPASETQEDEELRNAATVIGDRYMRRISKKSAGRLLDGREWNEFPETNLNGSKIP